MAADIRLVDFGHRHGKFRGDTVLVSLFVYGTLRTPMGGAEEDTRNHARIQNHITSSTPAVLEEADLLSFIHYPGIWPGAGSVVGEILEIDEEGLEICDEIEAHPDWYSRKRVVVEADDGGIREVWTYWAPEAMVESGRRIESGDWFSRDRSLHDGRTLEQALAEDKKNLW